MRSAETFSKRKKASSDCIILMRLPGHRMQDNSIPPIPIPCLKKSGLESVSETHLADLFFPKLRE